MRGRGTRTAPHIAKEFVIYDFSAIIIILMEATPTFTGTGGGQPR
jgi:hypothetical protein